MGDKVTPEEASLVLGVEPVVVRRWQESGAMPTPIPDDYFDAVIDFRLRIEEAFRRKIDQQRAPEDVPHG